MSVDQKHDPLVERLIPWPRSLTFESGHLQLNSIEFLGSYADHTSAIERAALDQAIVRLSSLLGASANARKWAPANSNPQTISIQLPVAQRVPLTGDPWPALGIDESYTLTVSNSSIEIRAQARWGALHALTTLAQLVDAQGAIGCVHIEDKPRFAWRGLMLDPARHFLSLPSLQQTLDLMAFYKLNVLHLHLSDDQGFRFGSTAYPQLASELHYSKEQLTALVQYAAERGVRIVPELDVPGHVSSWLVGYPDLGAQLPSLCQSATKPAHRFGVHKACLDPTNEQVYVVIDDLIAELVAVFPDQYLHIGGDEVHPNWWTNNQAVQDMMRRAKINDVSELQALFNRRISERLALHNRQFIGWDEILHPQMPAAAVVQSWRGATATERALTSGHDCVVSAGYYLDLMYPADVHYAYDPEAGTDDLLQWEDELLADPRFVHVADGMRWTQQWREEAALPAASARGSILGAEACLWGELVDDATLPTRLWTRMPVLAERFWSAAEVDDFDSAFSRTQRSLEQLAHYQLLDLAGIKFQTGTLQSWQSLVALLEPVKWYARLLGEQALQARLMGTEMPQARPYDIHTPLTKTIDYLPAQSAHVWQVSHLLETVEKGAGSEQAAAVNQLRQKAQGWLQFADRQDCPDELKSCRDAVVDLGKLVNDHLADSLDEQALEEYWQQIVLPKGEFIVALGITVGQWLRRQVRD